MGRSLRISGKGAIHHVISRCNNDEFLFLGNGEFQKYLEIIAKYKKEFAFKLFHYALLHNHIHLQIQIGQEANVSEIMQRINGEFASWYNYKYKRKGHFWQGRFRSTLIGDEDYFLRCGIYIELNAVRAGLIRQSQQWKYSSIRVYTEGEKNKLIDLSPVYLSLGENEKERIEEYKQLLLLERVRTEAIQYALERENKKELRRLLRNNIEDLIPFKKKITKLFKRGISNVINSY